MRSAPPSVGSTESVHLQGRRPEVQARPFLASHNVHNTRRNAIGWLCRGAGTCLHSRAACPCAGPCTAEAEALLSLLLDCPDPYAAPAAGRALAFALRTARPEVVLGPMGGSNPTHLSARVGLGTHF